ncbi:MAG: H-X9-DG-CTERM domain-containing protein [Armatimonadota bacterium]
MLADLTSGKTNKPYIMDDGKTSLKQAVAQVDTRHNKGAVFAYVDGHVTWLSKETIQPIIFLPSILDVSQITTPLSLGILFTPVANFSGGNYTTNLRDSLVKAGLPLAMGTGWDGNGYVQFHDSTSTSEYQLTSGALALQPGSGTYSDANATAKPPTWWKLGPGGTTVSAPNYGVGAAAQWNVGGSAASQNVSFIRALQDTGFATPVTLTMVPNGTITGFRLLAVVADAANGNIPATTSVTRMKVGAQETLVTAGDADWTIPAGTANSASALGIAVPVSANVPIEITVSVGSGGVNPGYFYAFER